MKILFSMRHPGALRNFASTLQTLAERQHQVHLVFGQQDKQGDDRLLAALTREFPAITCADLGRKTPWRLGGVVVRNAVSGSRSCEGWVDQLEEFAVDPALGATNLDLHDPAVGRVTEQHPLGLPQVGNGHVRQEMDFQQVPRGVNLNLHWLLRWSSGPLRPFAMFVARGSRLDSKVRFSAA